jgi:hypothetical protein
MDRPGDEEEDGLLTLVSRFRSSPDLDAGASSELWNQKGH